MAVGSGGFYTNNLTIGDNSDLDGAGLVPVDLQSDGGAAPQTLAFTTDQLGAGSFEILAAAGASQGNAAQISKRRVFVTVTASTQGVKLPTAVAGAEVIVCAASAVGVKVYPFLGDRIQGAATNAAVALVLNKSSIFEAVDSINWRVVKGA